MRLLPLLAVALAQAQQPALRPEQLFDLGVKQFDSGKAAEAFATFTRLAAMDPKELATRAYLARAALRLKKTVPAKENLGILRRLAPTDGMLHAQLVEWAFEEERGPLALEEARFTAELPLDPQRRARVFYLLGLLYGAAGDAAAAERQLDRAITMDPQPLYYAARVTAKSTGSDLRIDRALLASSLARFPQSRELLFLDAIWRIDAADLTGAEAAQQRLAAAHPNSAATYSVRGRLDLNALEFERAAKAFETAVQLEPADAISHYYLGLAYKKLGRDEDAVAQWKLAAARNPGYADAWFELGRGLADARKDAEAKKALERAIALVPRLAGAYNALAQVERRLGNAQAAAKHAARFKELSLEANQDRKAAAPSR